MPTSPSAVSRRSFTRLFALGGSAALLADPAWARAMGARAAAGARRPGRRRSVLEERARAVRDAARAVGDERRQPLPGLAAGGRGADAREPQRGRRSLAQQPLAADAREGEDPGRAGRVPAGDARRDHHHAQHQRVEQHGLERPRPQGRRRGAAARGQPSQQPHRLAGEGQAVRLLGRGRAAEEPAPRPRVLRRRLQQGDDAADAGGVGHAPDQHRRRHHAGEGTGGAGPFARRAVPARRGAELRPARRQPGRHPARLLLRQRPQVAVRRARMRRALREQDARRPSCGPASTAPIPAPSASPRPSRASASATRRR